jgi:NAD(P)-dependent dehydrogenase (short-subunit alcohol dehydrogenase family)
VDVLAQKVALITGGAQGLGAAICDVLAQAGSTVVVADLNISRAQKVADRLQSEGRQAVAIALDVTRPEQCDSVVNQVLERCGRIDIAINSAGVDRTVEVEQLSPEEWDHVLAVNLNGPFYLSRRLFPAMRKNGGGHIVNIASTAAKRAWANASAYHASKWGLLGLSHALHVEGRPQNIKVTAVVAGGMRTPFLLDRFPDLDPTLLQDPRNVAETVLFVLTRPAETVIPEIMVLPMRETSWP